VLAGAVRTIFIDNATLAGLFRPHRVHRDRLVEDN